MLFKMNIVIKWLYLGEYLNQSALTSLILYEETTYYDFSLSMYDDGNEE